jgi:hypothetical protein
MDPISPTDSKVGRTFLSKQVRQVAIICKFDNAEKFTGQSARRGSISKMASSGVASGEILGHPRHKSVGINTVYQSCNMSMSDHRNCCFLIGTCSTEQKSTGNYPTNSIQQVPLPLFHFPCTVQYNQYSFPMVQYHAPVTYHSQSVCTNYGNVSGTNPTYSNGVFTNTEIKVRNN